MRSLTVAVLVALGVGCAPSKPATAPVPDNSISTSAASLPVNRAGVRVDGIDGTVMTGEMLNGSITIDSGQGPLTLQSGHIHTITFASDGDRIEADNINVAGKIREQQFNLKTKHGVFALQRDRVRRITFINNLPDEADVMVRTAPVTVSPNTTATSPAPSPAPARAASPTTAPSATMRTTVPPTATRYRRGE